jgi:hypothetical protein
MQMGAPGFFGFGLTARFSVGFEFCMLDPLALETTATHLPVTNQAPFQ